MFDHDDPTTWPALLRVSQIVADPSKDYPGVVPVSRAHWLRGVAAGHYPAPVKLGAKIVAWRKADVLKLIEHGTPRRKRRAA